MLGNLQLYIISIDADVIAFISGLYIDASPETALYQDIPQPYDIHIVYEASCLRL